VQSEAALRNLATRYPYDSEDHQMSLRGSTQEICHQLKEDIQERLDKAGDLTAGMWRRKVSLIPRFEHFELDPPNPDRVEARKRRPQRWVSDQRGAWERSGRSRGAGA
jgi:Cft2 family RNA processing exonuclease